MEIPDFLNSFDDFQFWFIKKLQGKFPILINNVLKLDEYRMLVEKLMLTNGLQLLKDSSIIPEWINSKDSAEKFIWLDFSTVKKTWKISHYSFTRAFNSTYSNS